MGFCREPRRNGVSGRLAGFGMVHVSKLVLALLGLAALAPAQFRIEGSLGRHLQVGVQLGARCAPPVCAPRDRDRCDDRRDDRCDDRRAPRGRWETVCEQVWIEGHWDQQYVPDRYGWVCDPCGHRHWGIVEPAHWQQVWVPGHHETRQRRVWVRC